MSFITIACMTSVQSPARLRRFLTAAVVGGMVLALSACTPVFLVGDSVMVGAGPVANDKLDDMGWIPSHDGRVGRQTSEGLSVIQAKRGDTQYFVVELGYNDAASSSLYRSRLRSVLDELAGAQKVVVVNLAESRSYYVSGNQIIRDEVAAHPNAVIADWASIVAYTPGLTGSDGIHLTTKGNERMAQLIADTLGWAP